MTLASFMRHPDQTGYNAPSWQKTLSGYGSPGLPRSQFVRGIPIGPGLQLISSKDKPGMNYNFDELPDRRSTESAKWLWFGEDMLPMWVADMDFRSPEPVIRALQERVAHGVFGYPLEPKGLREAVVNWLGARQGWQVNASDVLMIPGVVTGLNVAAQSMLSADDGILIQPPVYMPFLDIPRLAGATRQDATLTLDSDGTYSIDWDAFERAITPQTRMFILCNPHNPVGRVFTRAELEHIAEICLRHDLLICSDEIHSDLVFSGHRHIPMASLSPEVAQRTITLLAPSKTFNIAGLSCSVAIISDPELRKRFNQGHRGLMHGVNVLGLTASLAAYQEGAEWLDQLMVYLEGNRDLLYQFANHKLPGARMANPEGTYLAWIDCREMGIGDKPAAFFKEKARVVVTEGSAFGPGGDGFIRLNFGCPRPMLVEALEKMRAAVLKNQ
jgi:cysteine-S-conjugate beta-lyase